MPKRKSRCQSSSSSSAVAVTAATAKRQKTAANANADANANINANVNINDNLDDDVDVAIHRDSITGRLYYGTYTAMLTSNVNTKGTSAKANVATTLSVGDVVAVVSKKKGRGRLPKNKSTVCWKTCEILAMYKNAEKQKNRRKSSRLVQEQKLGELRSGRKGLI